MSFLREQRTVIAPVHPSMTPDAREMTLVLEFTALREGVFHFEAGGGAVRAAHRLGGLPA